MTYSLSGSGSHSIGSGVGQLHIDVTTVPSIAGSGRANPTNLYDVGLLRPGDGTGFWEPIPVIGGPQWIGLPTGTTTIDFALFNGAVIAVTEVALPNPFEGPAGATGATGAAGATGPAGPTGPAGGSGVLDYVLVEDHQTAGTDGGTFTSGAWRTRTLNTIVVDTASIASVASNAVTLPAGTYRYRVSAPAHQADHHKVRLFNVTDSSVIAEGQNAYAASANNGLTVSEAVGRFVISGAKAIRIEHRCATTSTGNGLGVNINSQFAVANEIYARAEFWKES